MDLNYFASEKREEMKVKHKIWYEGVRKELSVNFPEIAISNFIFFRALKFDMHFC